MSTCALVVLLVMSTACSFKIFEDLDTDPHPPTVGVAGLVVFVPPPEPAPEPEPELPPEPEPEPASAAAARAARAIPWDSGGFTLSSGQSFQVGVAYTDVGGDIVKFQIRDRDGALAMDLLPVDQTYFTGTSGTVLCPATAADAVPVGIEITGLLGPHRLELWAEDSHLSRSEKVEFVITLVP